MKRPWDVKKRPVPMQAPRCPLQSCPSRVWTLPRSQPRDIARRPPGSFATRCATDPRTVTRPLELSEQRADPGFSRLAAADEAGELSPRPRLR
jgi:hypothetical protein